MFIILFILIAFSVVVYSCCSACGWLADKEDKAEVEEYLKNN